MVLLLAGCGDQVVGEFTSSAAGGTGSGDGVASTGGTVGTGDDLATSDAAGSEEGEQPWAGGCFSDEFDQAALDDNLWNVWAEPGTSWTQTLGVLRFTPGAVGLSYTGITSGWRYRFPFDDAHISLEIATAPPDAAPVNVYLQLLEEPYVFSMRYGSGQIDVSISDENGIDPQDTFASPQPPRWMRIRGEAEVVHFETSMDALTWTTLTSYPQPTSIVNGRPLVMVETVGEYPEQSPVEVERFDACAVF